MSDSPKGNRNGSPSMVKRTRRRMSARQRAASRAAHRAANYKAAKAPPTPLVMKPFQAWQQFCARTGTSIHSVTFYRWIWRWQIGSVRLGGKIFIPISELDRLIERRLAGERF